jgi:hypothetical protein
MIPSFMQFRMAQHIRNLHPSIESQSNAFVDASNFSMSDTINDNNISQLASCIVANDPMHRRFLDKSLSVLCPKDRLDLSAYIGWWEKSGRDIEWLASGYNLFVRETVVEQIRFKRERCYRFSTYSEVAAAGYTAPEYMEPYMVGLALSLFFWPNHVALKDFSCGVGSLLFARRALP